MSSSQNIITGRRKNIAPFGGSFGTRIHKRISRGLGIDISKYRAAAAQSTHDGRSLGAEGKSIFATSIGSLYLQIKPTRNRTPSRSSAINIGPPGRGGCFGRGMEISLFISELETKLINTQRPKDTMHYPSRSLYVRLSICLDAFVPVHEGTAGTSHQQNNNESNK